MKKNKEISLKELTQKMVGQIDESTPDGLNVLSEIYSIAAEKWLEQSARAKGGVA